MIAHRRLFVAVITGALIVAGAIATGMPASPANAALLSVTVGTTRAVVPAGGSENAGGAPRERDGLRHLLVHVERAMAITARPGAGRTIGTMPAGSRYYGIPTVAWVRDVSRDGRYGLVDVPYVGYRATGWIRLRGLDSSHTRVSVEADLSEHSITVRRGDDVLFRAAATTGAPLSPTPVGRYYVTDRVPFPNGGMLGTFAFGISGIQPNLPPGWGGGDQLAIHGTNDASSIGRSASAGCLRVSEGTLARLRRVLRLGTPVVIHP